MCKHGLCEDPLDDDEHEIELILTQKDVHDKVQSKESGLLKQDSNNLTPAATHIIESIKNITIAEGVSMPSLNDSSTFSLPDIQMPMRSDDEKLNSTDSSSFLFPPRSGTWSDGPEYQSTTYSMSTPWYNKETSDANDSSSSMDTSKDASSMAACL